MNNFFVVPFPFENFPFVVLVLLFHRYLLHFVMCFGSSIKNVFLLVGICTFIYILCCFLLPCSLKLLFIVLIVDKDAFLAELIFKEPFFFVILNILRKLFFLKVRICFCSKRLQRFKLFSFGGERIEKMVSIKSNHILYIIPFEKPFKIGFDSLACYLKILGKKVRQLEYLIMSVFFYIYCIHFVFES